MEGIIHQTREARSEGVDPDPARTPTNIEEESDTTTSTANHNTGGTSDIIAGTHALAPKNAATMTNPNYKKNSRK